MESIIYRLTNLLVKHQDIRTKDWLMAKTPWALLTILGIYLYVCVYFGPKYMRKRKPFELKNCLLIYNVVQVAISCFICYEGYKTGIIGEYNFMCQPISYANDPSTLRLISVGWFYYMAKLTELLDTLFFVLRKNERQVTFLNLYHHTLMPFSAFLTLKYLAGGPAIPIVLINSFVHIIMYTYYLLAAFGPHMQKYLWWLQIVQFGIVFMHTSLMLLQPNCEHPKFLAAFYAFSSALFIYMFGMFYIKSYQKSKTLKSLKNESLFDTIKQEKFN